MKLVALQVQLYRNIVDTTPISVEDSVTCLVGKNESGKTAILQALFNLSPAYPSKLNFDEIEDYPRWRRVLDARAQSLPAVRPIQAKFSLDREELDRVCGLLETSLPEDCLLVAHRSYEGQLVVSIESDEQQIVSALAESLSEDPTTQKRLLGSATLNDFAARVDAVIAQTPAQNRGARRSLRDLRARTCAASKAIGGVDDEDKQQRLGAMLPKFFYFGEYSSLPGRIDLTQLLQTSPSELEDQERTALSLLRLAGVSGQEFIGGAFEERVAQLEAAANALTNEVFEYWTQNRDLVVNLMGDSQVIETGEGQTLVHRYLDIRLNDQRHQVTTNFGRRSTGFQWFFSFIAAFSEFDGRSNIIILLDEPGLGLHARAQADLLRFIDERLSPQNQVIYTTHSPFMVNTERLQRVRLVEDRTTRETPDLGARVSQDVLTVHGDTLFPLQAALGYDLAQSLFVGPHNLVVEGSSDFTYLTTLSEYMEEKGRSGLDTRWDVTPVGGADKVPTFVALLRTQTDITVLLDASGTGNQRLADLADDGLLDGKRILTVGQILRRRRADIEDLFEESEYLELYNKAFSTNVEASDLQGNDPIVKRIERHAGKEFNHGRPATALLRERTDVLPRLSTETLDRFERLFRRINQTLSE